MENFLELLICILLLFLNGAACFICYELYKIFEQDEKHMAMMGSLAREAITYLKRLVNKGDA